MVNDSQLRGTTCWMSLLCALTLAFGSSCGASGLREIRGTVRVGDVPIRSAEVTIVEAKEATARYENRLNTAKSNLAALSGKLRNLSDRKESIEKDRTAKVYKTMFSETGPADKEQLRQEIDALTTTLTAINSDEVALRGEVLAWKSSDAFFEKRWTNVLAVARTTDNGEFSVRIPSDRKCWLAIPGKTQNSPTPVPGWLMPIPPENAPILLCETNAISINP
jgi:hypothetical protein